MDVHLLIYDLSRGLASQMSMGILGFQLDAIYHTSIELQGREYVYDGGIIDITPGSSHLGQPLQRLKLGTTNLPMDIVHEYLDSVRSIFTVEVSPTHCKQRLIISCANQVSLTICSNTTATTSQIPSPTFSSAKASQTTLSTCHKPSWTHQWAACYFHNSRKESMPADRMVQY